MIAHSDVEFSDEEQLDRDLHARIEQRLQPCVASLVCSHCPVNICMYVFVCVCVYIYICWCVMHNRLEDEIIGSDLSDPDFGNEMFDIIESNSAITRKLLDSGSLDSEALKQTEALLLSSVNDPTALDAFSVTANNSTLPQRMLQLGTARTTCKALLCMIALCVSASILCYVLCVMCVCVYVCVCVNV